MRQSSNTDGANRKAPIRATLIGGGIAAMAAAAFLIRDGDLRGCDINIIEALGRPGGALDGAGSAETGYVLRGGRMFERKYLCTFELFASIPALGGSGSVTDEILRWNATMQTSSKSRLVRNGQRETAPTFGLREGHILTIERLLVEPESMLGRTTIAEQFEESFFQTDFWFLWCTTFAFQPWHSAVELKRYLARFAHMVDGFSRLEGIMRTVYNQYDSLVRPLEAWLRERGVHFLLDTEVLDLQLVHRDGATMVEWIKTRRDGHDTTTLVGSDELVLVTLGSMTEGSTLGSMDTAPAVTEAAPASGGSWALWRSIAAGRPAFGHPEVFCEHVDRSRWVSFTATLHDPAFLRLVRDLTGNVPGEGGLITFPDSAWLASIVVPHQPHFLGQPEGVDVVWGYGLTMDRPGDFVAKPMAACTGREIMTEVLGHLRAGAATAAILDNCICIPCAMPFITSQFLPRARGDRPQVVPEGTRNLAFIGQFCEMRDDVVFTVEYSIRTAQTAVASLLKLKRRPPAVYKGKYDPRVLFHAFEALHDIGKVA
jgi:oleate hydratase